MIMSHRIIITLKNKVEHDGNLREELEFCIKKANWTPPAVCFSAPNWTPPKKKHPISNLHDFYVYLNVLINTTPVDSSFDNLFHGLFYIVSQDDNKLQQAPEFKDFQEWLVLFIEQYGCYMNTPGSANGLYSFTNDKTFRIEDFLVPPGGFNSFNSFFSRRIKPGKRPIGTETHPYDEPTEGHPLPPTKDVDPISVHENMCSDDIVTVPADSVYKGYWKIGEYGEISIQVSKGNKYYSIKELLKGSKYADRFNGGLFTHSYLTVFTYHRYHVPVRGVIKETKVISENVFANVIKKDNGDLSATDGTGYQFRQDRALVVIESPVGLVALLPIGMDFISSCNISVDEGDYVNKGDEFGYFLFGGSDMIMLFEKDSVNIQLPEKPKEEKLYKLGQVFAKRKV
jgi:phosphatidylserine decarboxylase